MQPRSNGATKIISLIISIEFARKVRGEESEYYEVEQPSASGRFSFGTKFVVDADAPNPIAFPFDTAILLGIIGILVFLLWQRTTTEIKGAAKIEVEHKVEIEVIQVGTQTEVMGRRNVNTQSQCKYTWYNETPRFTPLAEHSHGVFH